MKRIKKYKPKAGRNIIQELFDGIRQQAEETASALNDVAAALNDVTLTLEEQDATLISTVGVWRKTGEYWWAVPANGGGGLTAHELSKIIEGEEWHIS